MQALSLSLSHTDTRTHTCQIHTASPPALIQRPMSWTAIYRLSPGNTGVCVSVVVVVCVWYL